MADNVAITAGAGTNIATDDVGGIHYQEVKIALGLADAIDTLLDSGQQIMANSVPVVLASNHSDISIGPISPGSGNYNLGKGEDIP